MSAGTITERSPGVWRLRAFVRATGRQVSETYRAPKAVPGYGIKEAERRLATLVAAVAAGKYGGNATTVEVLMDQWITLAKRKGRSPSTIQGYNSKKVRIVQGLGQVQLDRLTVRDVDHFYDSLEAEGMTPSNIRGYHRVLVAALHQAERWDWVPRNVAALASPPQATRPPMRTPGPDMVRTIIEEADQARNPALGTAVFLAATTGMRRGELCALRWSDIDWVGETIHVATSIWETKTGFGVKTPKSGQERRISLDPESAKALRRRWEKVAAEARECEVEVDPSGYVLSYEAVGLRPMLPSALSQAYVRVVERCAGTAPKKGRPKPEKTARELGWPRLHDLRHFAASQMIGAGFDPATVAARLGHANSAVTLKVYSHALEQRDREAAAMLGRLVAPQQKEIR